MISSPLHELLIRLADTNIILGHRLSQWCGHGPILEEDIAITNIALDHIGLGTNLLEYAATLYTDGTTADDLAFKRNERNYKNVLLSEIPNGDYAMTIARQFLIDVYQWYVYQGLCESTNEQLKAIAQKAIKEIEYHVRHTTQWVLRLGDGTEESHNRIQDAFNELWMYVFDLFDEDETDKILANEKVIASYATIEPKWKTHVEQILTQATLQIPSYAFTQKGSRNGVHTEHLGFLLAEMQYYQRMYPDAKW